MKKIYHLFFKRCSVQQIVLAAMMLLSFGVWPNLLKAQEFTIETCSNLGSTAHAIYTTSSANAVNRHATIYPASQLNGIAGQTLSQLYLERTTSTGSLSGPANLKIYLLETTDSEWPAGALDWASTISGATLVYDADPGTAIGSTAGWKGFAFSNNFVYSGGANNLALLMEYSGPTTSSSSISWSYEYGSPCISTTNSNTTRYSNATTGILPTSLTTLNYRRPVIGFGLLLSCYPPSNLTLVSNTATTADISWTAPTVPPNDGYEYYTNNTGVPPTGSTTASGTTAAGVTNATVAGLLPGANYIWVRSVCGAGDKSPWQGSLAVYTAPTNDDCSGAISLTQDATCTNVSGTTAAATASAVPEVCSGLADDDVWFSFVATSTDAKIDLTNVVAATGSSTTDYFQVFSGDCNNLVSISCQTTSSGIIGGLTVGETYFIRVYTSLNTSTINFDICVTQLAAAPTSCPTLIAPADNSTVSATPNLDWVTSTNASGYNIYLDGNNPPTTLYATVYNNNVTNFQVTTPLATGDYYWYVESFNSVGTPVCSTTPRLFTVVVPPANDEAATAIALTANPDLTCTAVTAGTTAGASESLDIAPSCSATGINDDVWYSFVATSAGHRISFIGATSTMAAAIYSGSIGSLTQVGTACGSTTVDAGSLTIGQTYYVRAYSTSSTSSTFANFDICLAVLPDPPANDECANAITLTVNPDMNCAFTTLATTVNATGSNETDPTCAVTGVNDDVWYKFVATASSHIISLTTDSGNTDRAMQLYSGSCGGLIPVICSDPETMTASGLTVGETYTLRVYTYSSLSTTRSKFNICVGTLPPTPANDESTGAIALTVNADYNCAVTTSGTTFSATASAEAAPTCSATGINDDVWYSFDATATDHKISFANTSSTMAAALYEGAPGSLTFITGVCASTTLYATGLTVGNTYYVRAYTSSSTVGTASNFDICVGTLPPPPANDESTGAIALTVNADYSCSVITSGTTYGATASAEAAPTCSATGINDDVWYSFDATATGHRISFTNTTSTMVAALYEGAPGSLTFVTGACASTTLNATGLTVGTTYYVRAYTLSSSVNTGTNFDICVGTPPPPPANDEAAGAIEVVLGAGCPTTYFSNEFSTQSVGEPTGSCANLIGYATVWYKFTAPVSGAVRISTDAGSGNTLTDSRIALFSTTNVNDYSTFSIIGCDEDGGSALGSGFMSVIYATGLTSGSTYYIQVDKFGSSSSAGSFCLIVDELNASMLSTATNCVSGQSISGSQTAYTGWVNLMDADSKLIASVRNAAGGSASGYFTKSQNIHTGAVRQNTYGTAYLDRNFFINNSSATNVEVQFYFLASELAALNTADGTTLASLAVSHQSGTSCHADFSRAFGVPDVLPQLSNGTSTDGLLNWITVNTPSFSNFYLHKNTAVLPITLEYFKGYKQSNINNQLSWKVDCNNAVNNTMVLERSADQQRFTAIHSLTPQSADQCNQPFNYTDAAANPGMNYYRLKMVDVDGSARYSNVVAIYNGSQAFELIGLAPNPVKNLTSLKIASDKAVVMNLSITDIAGKKLSTQKVSLVTGQNIISLDFSKLAAGTYQITGITADATLQTIRFVKQ